MTDLLGIIAVAVITSAIFWAAFLFVLSPYLMGDGAPATAHALKDLVFGSRPRLQYPNRFVVASTLLITTRVFNLAPDEFVITRIDPTSKEMTGSDATIQVTETR